MLSKVASNPRLVPSVAMPSQQRTALSQLSYLTIKKIHRLDHATQPINIRADAGVIEIKSSLIQTYQAGSSRRHVCCCITATNTGLIYTSFPP